MGRLKTEQERDRKAEYAKKEAITRKLVLNLNDDVAYYKNMVKELSGEIIDMVNLSSYTYKILEGHGDEKDLENTKKALKKIIDNYLEGNPDNVLTHKGSDVQPETVKKIDDATKELDAMENAIEVEAKDVQEG